MKLRTLAIAVAMASVPFAAQADLKISGDVTVKYQDNGTKTFSEGGTEVIFSASEKVGGLTIGGTATANLNSTGDTVTTDDVNVYISGGFGKVTMGDTDNGCDTVDTGWVASDVFISHSSGGCKGADVNNITYTRGLGAATVAASFSPDATGGNDNFAVGIKGKMGPATASLGYESDIGGLTNTVLGLSGSIGPVSVGVRANKLEGGDTDVGYTANYSSGANTMYLGIGDVGNNDTTFIGFTRKVGNNTKFVIEHVQDDSAADDNTVVGVVHSF